MERFSGYDSHGMIEPRYGPVAGYSAFSESYASKTEQVVEYGGKPYGGIHQLLQPAWNASPHDRLKKTDKSSPRVRPGSAWNNNSPPSKNGKYNNFSSDESDESDDDDVVCDKNGYCYPKPKHPEHYVGNDYYATKKNPNNYKPKPCENGYATSPPQPYYKPTKPNGNGYTTPPPQPYYETQKPKHNGNGYTTPPPQPYYENDYTTPPPQPYYEAPNNKPMLYKPLPNIKTRLDHSNKGTPESQLENMRISSPMSAKSHRSPFTSSPKSSSPRSPYSSSPRKDQGYRETIDSVEARRRYGGASVDAPVEQYKGTIDSQEAARRYNGIFV